MGTNRTEEFGYGVTRLTGKEEARETERETERKTSRVCLFLKPYSSISMIPHLNFGMLRMDTHTHKKTDVIILRRHVV